MRTTDHDETYPAIRTMDSFELEAQAIEQRRARREFERDCTKCLRMWCFTCGLLLFALFVWIWHIIATSTDPLPKPQASQTRTAPF